MKIETYEKCEISKASLWYDTYSSDYIFFDMYNFQQNHDSTAALTNIMIWALVW